MAHELEPGRKLARHRGSFLEGPTGSARARPWTLAGGVFLVVVARTTLDGASGVRGTRPRA